MKRKKILKIQKTLKRLNGMCHHHLFTMTIIQLFKEGTSSSCNLATRTQHNLIAMIKTFLHQFYVKNVKVLYTTKKCKVPIRVSLMQT